MIKKRLLIISKWGYPAGGGEAFLFNSAQWLLSEWEVYWISLYNYNNIAYSGYDFYNESGINMIKLPSINSLEKMTYLIKPDLIHHQGNLRMEILSIANKLNIPFITGFHYWTDAIDLYNGNIGIMENIDKHKPAPQFSTILEKSSNIYCCSEYIRDIIFKVSGQYINNIIYPIPNIPPTIKQKPIKERKYITIINIHPLKGGNTLLDIIDDIEYPLMIINSEPIPNDFKIKIEEKINNRKTVAETIYLNYQNNIFDIYLKTRILLIPTDVDETFNRVCLEAMMLKVPIITSGKGNIINLIGNDYPYICKEKRGWISTIKSLYNNYTKLNSITKLMYQRSTENFKLSDAKIAFNNILTYTGNYGIIVPWCDQGLGIQARNYVRILNEYGKKVAVFSFTPYFSNNISNYQKNKEWEYDDIYYSPNIRENITDEEIYNFVEKYKIRNMIIPETCWDRIFEIAKLLNKINIKTFAIPNIEIVRKDELYKHKYFDHIIANNHLCEKIFINHGFNNIQYLGYAPYTTPINVDTDNSNNSNNSNNTTTNNVNNSVNNMDNNKVECIKFIMIGGFNAFSRKQCKEICESFMNIKNNNWKLTITILKNMEVNISHPNINIIIDHLSFDELTKLYKSHDIAIQVSKQEGLGLGFYDAIYNGLPVITLDTPPHNEIITDDIGWKIPCYYKPITDNNDALIEAAYFNNDDLTNLVEKIIQENSLIKKNNIEEYCRKNTNIFRENIKKIFN
jgi:hypothetical protein